MPKLTQDEREELKSIWKELGVSAFPVESEDIEDIENWCAKIAQAREEKFNDKIRKFITLNQVYFSTEEGVNGQESFVKTKDLTKLLELNKKK